MDAKENSPNYRRFVAQYGRSAYELEAIPPQELQLVLDQVIRQVIDIEAFNQEIDAERQDAAYLETKRAQVKQALLDEIPPDLEFPNIPGSS